MDADNRTISLSEQILYSTLRIEAGSSVGTGFLFSLTVDDKSYPILITNKHVVNNNENETVHFYLHLIDTNGIEECNHQVTWKTKWHFHPNQDLCFTFVTPLIVEIKKQTGKDVKCIHFSDDLILDNESLKQLSAIEEVVMVGYPNGLYDKVHNYPLFRHGYTSSHPGFDFDNKGIGVIDISAFHGSSGSPVFIYNQGVYQSNNKLNLGSRLIFLGVLSSGVTTDVDGKITVVEAPTSTGLVVKSSILINLGFYIRAEHILYFREMIRKIDSTR